MIGRRPILILLVAVLAGCARPNQANIELRKQIQSLQHELDSCRAARASDAQVMRGLQARSPTEPTLPSEQLAKLFTTHGISFGRLTGGADLDPNKPGDEGVTVYVSPIDEDGQPIKAAGSFVVEVFDLAAEGDARIGRWAFPEEEARKRWAGYFILQYNYVLTCPWQKEPQHADLTLRVSFVDELTKIPFWAERQIHVKLPPPPSRPPNHPAHVAGENADDPISAITDKSSAIHARSRGSHRCSSVDPILPGWLLQRPAGPVV